MESGRNDGGGSSATVLLDAPGTREDVRALTSPQLVVPLSCTRHRAEVGGGGAGAGG